jgi:hypothetical protein
MPLFPYLPLPTGPFPVATVLLNDLQLGVTEATDVVGDCRLTVQLWYPAADVSGQPRAPYDGSAGLLSIRRWVRIPAMFAAPMATAHDRYPLLLFLPGWSGKRGENTFLVQDLASRGFVVAVIGYDAPSCMRDEGMVHGKRIMAGSRAWPPAWCGCLMP